MMASFDFQLVDGLPDCRLRGPHRRATTVVWGRMLMEKVYCANCGGNGGLITAESAAHVFYLCDRCVEINGAPPAPEIPEALVRGR